MTRRLSPETLMVLEVMKEDPDRLHYGRQLRYDTGLGPGTIYPILHLLERRGWVSSTWEDIDPVRAGRPRRRLYRLTEPDVPHADLS